MIAAYSFKARFVNPIRIGLGLPLLGQIGKEEAPTSTEQIKPKRQTIRAHGARRHARIGDAVRCYWGMRTKGCFLIGEGKCVAVRGVYLKWTEFSEFDTFPVAEIAPGRCKRQGDLEKIPDLDAFAQSDGFDDFGEMREFWRENHGYESFEGLLIRWEEDTTMRTLAMLNESGDTTSQLDSRP